MNMLDYAVLGGIAAALVCAALWILREKRRGKNSRCGCGCGRCAEKDCGERKKVAKKMIYYMIFIIIFLQIY